MSTYMFSQYIRDITGIPRDSVQYSLTIFGDPRI